LLAKRFHLPDNARTNRINDLSILWPRGLETDSDGQWKVWSNADHIPLSLDMPLSMDQIRRIGERKA
jgi:hypothetical protein